MRRIECLTAKPTHSKSNRNKIEGEAWSALLPSDVPNIARSVNWRE